MNDEITHRQLRLIAEDGGQLGVVSGSEANQKARAEGLDLIEIAPNAAPPVCKIMDYGKFKYEEKKKEALAKKKQVDMTVKEIKFRPKTDVHDIDFKVKHILRFLDEGHRVKLTVFFRGREMAFKEKGFELLRKVVGLLGEAGVVDSNPKFEGRRLVMQLVPGGKGKKSATKGSDKSSPKKAPKKSEDSDIKGTSKNTDSPSSVKPQGASAN